MSPHRARPQRIHVCMKQPCSYCVARRNVQHPPDSVGGYAELMTAVANELRRRRAVRAHESASPRKKRRRP
jgi:hypothetical protein